MPGPVQAAKACVRSEHADVLDAIDACADEVCAPWDGDYTRDSRAIVKPMRAALKTRGVLDRLPAVLADAAGAAGYDLSAPPVAVPPYVVVTSRGPILRATIDPGRLVIRFDAFDVVGGRGRRRYRRLKSVRLAVSLE